MSHPGYSFWIGYEFEKLESLYWYVEKTKSHSMRPTAMIAVCKYHIKPQQDVNIFCPADPSVKAKSQVYLCAFSIVLLPSSVM